MMTVMKSVNDNTKNRNDETGRKLMSVNEIKEKNMNPLGKNKKMLSNSF
jgi:hypothetical protein